jgi:hypothetical protein
MHRTQSKPARTRIFELQSSVLNRFRNNRGQSGHKLVPEAKSIVDEIAPLLHLRTAEAASRSTHYDKRFYESMFPVIVWSLEHQNVHKSPDANDCEKTQERK